MRITFNKDVGPVVSRVEPPREDMMAAVLRLTDLAGRVERAEASTRRLDDVAHDCAAAMQQISEIRRDLGGTRRAGR